MTTCQEMSTYTRFAAVASKVCRFCGFKHPLQSCPPSESYPPAAAQREVSLAMNNKNEVSLIVSPFKETPDPEYNPRVPFSSVKRFGHYRAFGDAKRPIVAELEDGRRVWVPLKDQTDDARKMIRRRLRAEVHPDYRALSPAVPEMFSWEHASGCQGCADGSAVIDGEHREPYFYKGAWRRKCRKGTSQ